MWSEDDETYEAGGSQAAAQLLLVLCRPELIQALQAMALGPVGRSQIQVGQTPVPAAAFGNLVGSLAGRAVAEHHRVVAGRETGTPQYLVGADGEAVVDLSDPDQRADRLLEVIAESEPAWSAAEDWESDEPDELDLLDALGFGDD